FKAHCTQPDEAFVTPRKLHTSKVIHRAHLCEQEEGLHHETHVCTGCYFRSICPSRLRCPDRGRGRSHLREPARDHHDHPSCQLRGFRRNGRQYLGNFPSRV